MNITNADYFTFNVDNSMLLIGQSGTGKSVLVDKYIERLVKSHAPDKLKFILLDMTGVDFDQLREKHQDYIKEDIKFDSGKGLDVLEVTAHLAEERANAQGKDPLLVLLIEECDMAAVDQEHFDSLLIRINKVASTANMKVIYSTSRPAPDVVSRELLESFDLVLAGTLSEADYNNLGIEKPEAHPRYDFVVTQRSQNLLFS